MKAIEQGMRWIFDHHGRAVARYYPFYIVIPILITIGLCTGIMVSFTMETDAEKLFGPRGSQSLHNRAIIEELYEDLVSENMLERHRTRIGKWGQVIITHYDGENVLQIPVIEEVLKLHDVITGFSIDYDGINYEYTDLCLTWENHCPEIPLLSLLHYNATEVGNISLTYPLVYTSSGEKIFIGSQLAGVTLNNEQLVAEASSIMLTYNLRYVTDEEQLLGAKWEQEFLEIVGNFQGNASNIYQHASRSFSDELDENALTVDLVAIVVVAVLSFSVLSLSVSDWVRTKPLLACSGVITAILALGSSLGLLLYAGVSYANVAASAPFLVLGVGVDDMFIMVSAWRQTDIRKPTEARLRESLSESAMSITITTLTDILAFGIGYISPFYSVRLLCIYSAVGVIFTYIYMITFFAAFIVITGYREEQNRHALTFQKVFPKTWAPSGAYYIFCAGGLPDWRFEMSQEKQHNAHSTESTNPSDSAVMIFFKKYYGPFLTGKVSAIIVVILYVVYLAITIWGAVTVEDGLDLKKAASDDSYLHAYYQVEETYFREFGPDMMIVATEELDYWDRDVQTEIENVMLELEDSKYFYNSSLSISWLREYLSFLKQLGIRKPSKERFFEVLQEQFLQIPAYGQFVPDVIVNAVNNSITSSRFYVLGKELDSSNKQRDMFLKIRHVLSKSKLKLIAFHSTAPWLLEQYIAIRQNTLLTLSVGISTMFIVSILLIPNPLCSLLVTLSVVSTVLGVFGFMSLWNIPLDSISMIGMVLALGFSIDYTAHLAYCFAVTPAGTSGRQRAILALYSVGAPIVQGALSTILAVSVLAFVPSYIYRTFIKLMLLVVSTGAFHGIVFLPVFLMLLVPIRKIEEIGVNEISSDEYDNYNHEVRFTYDNFLLSDEENGDRQKQKQRKYIRSDVNGSQVSYGSI